eukprot:gene777-261_t
MVGPPESATRKPLSVVVAANPKWGIGKDGELPWHIPRDLKHFKTVTTEINEKGRKNAVIMGRKTWESIPEKFRPLADRVNVVLSSTMTAPPADGVRVFKSLDEAVEKLSADEEVDQLFAIGGAGVYREALKHEDTTRVYLTRVMSDVECDTVIPDLFAEGFHPVSISKTHCTKDGNMSFDFCKLERVRPGFSTPMCDRTHPEWQYLDLIRDLIENAGSSDDRTGVGTLMKFGCSMRFDLSESFPLLTTKRVFWRGVMEELLWFVKGDTDGKHLSDKGIRIWDGNGSREFLDGRGLTNNREGDLGPVYGFQWRHFGAEYKDCDADYTGQGVDQLADIIDKIKNNPTDRRMIMSAWNPADLNKMALPPCHMFCQFHVQDGKLSCALYQRSCDMGLGVPFNIASYSLLTYMMAHITGLKPGEFVHFLGNTHVYKNHVDPLLEQLKRPPRPFPQLKIKRDVTEIDDFKAEDFEILCYKPYPKIAMEMAV